MGLRCDYNGVLLLDTILQTPISNTDNPVKIELLLSEALLLHQSLSSLEQQGVENSADVINELFQKITEAQRRAKKGIKAQKVRIKSLSNLNNLFTKKILSSGKPFVWSCHIRVLKLSRVQWLWN